MISGLMGFLSRTKAITLEDLRQGHGVDNLIRNTTEELGEYCKAISVEAGIKKKELTESSCEEAVDVVICALSLFYASGGTDEMLASYGMKKLDKWEERVCEKN